MLCFHTLFLLTVGFVEIKAIVGGVYVWDKNFPYQVSIRRKDKHVCGGTLISSSHVLTAAQCFRGKRRAKLYSVVSNIQSSKSGRTLDILRVDFHSDFYQSDEEDFVPQNDIAIVTLNYTLSADDNEKTIPINENNFMDNLICRITDQDSYLTVALPDQENCKALANEHWRGVNSDHLCVQRDLWLDWVGDVNTGSGDIGSSLVCDNMVVAVLSKTSEPEKKFTEIYTLVYKYTNFILDVLKRTFYKRGSKSSENSTDS